MAAMATRRLPASDDPDTPGGVVPDGPSPVRTRLTSTKRRRARLHDIQTTSSNQTPAAPRPQPARSAAEAARRRASAKPQRGSSSRHAPGWGRRPRWEPLAPPGGQAPRGSRKATRRGPEGLRGPAESSAPAPMAATTSATIGGTPGPPGAAAMTMSPASRPATIPRIHASSAARTASPSSSLSLSLEDPALAADAPAPLSPPRAPLQSRQDSSGAPVKSRRQAAGWPLSAAK